MLLISSFKECDQQTASSAFGVPQLFHGSHTLGPRHFPQDPSWGRLCAQLPVGLADFLSLLALRAFTGEPSLRFWKLSLPPLLLLPVVSQRHDSGYSSYF